MACILRTCVFTKKRLLFDDFSNLGRTLTYIVHNGRNLEVRIYIFQIYLTKINLYERYMVF